MQSKNSIRPHGRGGNCYHFGLPVGGICDGFHFLLGGLIKVEASGMSSQLEVGGCRAMSCALCAWKHAGRR